jgi:phosphoribosylanthranilate isomerase
MTTAGEHGNAPEMTAPAIKFCGIVDPAGIDAAITLRADYVGLVFFPSSPRHLTHARAAVLAARAGARIARVGLFVDADDWKIGEAVAAGALAALQLHGNEPPERAAAVRARFGLPVWKALPVTEPGDLARAEAYVGAADLVLFDARAPAGGAMPGGLGLAFDWTLLAGYRAPLPWGLAGGLSPDNVAEAVRIAHPPLVDVSSGIESAPGVKDRNRMTAFANAARSA